MPSPSRPLQLLGECLDIEGATSWIISATNIRLFSENDAGVASDTRDDPYVNILRGTIATFGAAVGGAEAVTTLPFDAAIGLPKSDFSPLSSRYLEDLANTVPQGT
jgi:hypothetical protein